MIRQAIDKLLAGEDLGGPGVRATLDELLSGPTVSVQAAAFFTALAMKGMTQEESAEIEAAQGRHAIDSSSHGGGRQIGYDIGHPKYCANLLIAQMMMGRGDDLSRKEAENAMEDVLSGHADDMRIAAFLTALRFKGETVDEVVGFATAMRRHGPRIFSDGRIHADEMLVDTCGTGGDARGTFNISTATAFVVAGAGVRVAKHGNRSATSLCGSADVLEQLGMRIDLPPASVARAIDEVGIGFLFAPAMHSATRNAAKVRRELGFRTVFNLLGPLTNPAEASAQVVGVYDAGVTELMAQALGELGVKRAFVVHGADGLDEISISGETHVSELRDGAVRNYMLAPEDFGVKRAPLEAIRGGDGKQNAEIIQKIFGGGGRTPHRDIVLANASAALVAAGRAANFLEGVQLAAESIDSGAAREKLEKLIAFSNATEFGQKQD
jgi:anthranilate phosphoribosyltransferase